MRSPPQPSCGAPPPDGGSASLTRPAVGGLGGATSRGAGQERKNVMLRIYEEILEVIRLLRPIVEQIEKHDRDLARQMKRAEASMVLNTREGSGSRGGTRRERYHNALGSTEETTGCVDTALALGYVDAVSPCIVDKLDHIRAVLWKNTH